MVSPLDPNVNCQFSLWCSDTGYCKDTPPIKASSAVWSTGTVDYLPKKLIYSATYSRLVLCTCTPSAHGEAREV